MKWASHVLEINCSNFSTRSVNHLEIWVRVSNYVKSHVTKLTITSRYNVSDWISLSLPNFPNSLAAHSIFLSSWAENCLSKRLPTDWGEADGCRGNRGNKYAEEKMLFRCFMYKRKSVNGSSSQRRNGIFPGKGWMWWSDQGRWDFMNYSVRASRYLSQCFDMNKQHEHVIRKSLKTIESYLMQQNILRAVEALFFLRFPRNFPVKASFFYEETFFICFSFRFTMCKYYEWENKRRLCKWKLCRFIIDALAEKRF